MTKTIENKAPFNSSVQLSNIGNQVPRAAYSIPEFCKAHRICEAFYYKLRNAGLGPREMRAFRRVTISIEAATDWRRAREHASQATENSAA